MARSWGGEAAEDRPEKVRGESEASRKLDYRSLGVYKGEIFGEFDWIGTSNREAIDVSGGRQQTEKAVS